MGYLIQEETVSLLGGSEKTRLNAKHLCCRTTWPLGSLPAVSPQQFILEHSAIELLTKLLAPTPKCDSASSDSRAETLEDGAWVETAVEASASSGPEHRSLTSAATREWTGSSWSPGLRTNSSEGTGYKDKKKRPLNAWRL